MIIGGNDLERLAASWGIPAGQVGPSSIDLVLSPRFTHMPARGKPVEYVLDPGDEFTFVPDGFYLGSVLERVELPPEMAARITVRSSPGRSGLSHMASDFIDQGFRGYPTVEFFVRRALSFRVGTVPVFQLVVHRASSHAMYSGRYQDQPGEPVPSRDNRFVDRGIE